MGATARINEVLEWEPPVEEGEKLEKFNGSLQFQDVGFGYKERERVLDGVSFTVAPGEAVGIVGQSGAGKSTLVHLATRVLSPTTGNIRLDGVDVGKLHSGWLRQEVISVVNQDPVLFTGSIEDNIRYGKLTATQSE
eukprot:Platyproteum_vivax@DN5388_c0_g1_i1.p1